MAAEVVSAKGLRVQLFEQMPTVGRKFLMAGRGGLNLTHSEPPEKFMRSYGSSADWLKPMLEQFDAEATRNWSHGLGVETFVGTSGRVFPKSMKASPLLRAWLKRLAGQGVSIHNGKRWAGWADDGDLLFSDSDGGQIRVKADATILALGGASWPKLGSNAGWVELLAERGVLIAPFRPANCGIDISWSLGFVNRFAGQALHGAAWICDGIRVRGEATITPYGLEGGAIYALSAGIRDAVALHGSTIVLADLRPELSMDALTHKLVRQRGGDSVSNVLRKAVNLDQPSINLMRESFGVELGKSAEELARQIKSVRLVVRAVQPLDRAISSAGGVRTDEIDGNSMLKALPGVFVAGEMLDWEAPTGGYLLQACLATGAAAARGVLTLHGNRRK